MTDVSIVVVSYNTSDLIQKCIDSVIKFSDNFSYEIIIVDNCSSDKSAEIIKKKYSDLILIENKSNVGFGRACNSGIGISNGEYVFLLNSDTILTNNAISYFLNFMRLNNFNHDIGVIGSCLLDSKFKTIHSFGSFPSFKGEINRLFSNHDKENLIDKFALTGFQEVDYLTGANLFFCKETVGKIGYFDPDYFMYYEEVDFQKRMAINNLKRLVIKGPKIIHLQGMSFDATMTSKKKFMIYDSMFKYFNKNVGFIENIAIRSLYLFFYSPIKILKNPFKIESYYILAFILNLKKNLKN